MAQKKIYKQYDQSDVEAVYRRGEWREWGPVRRWIEQEGEGDNELTPGEVHHLGEDIACLEEAGVPFEPDPARAFRLMREHCGH